jgi:hypothetical protein
VIESVKPTALMRNGKRDAAAPAFSGPRRASPMSNKVMLRLLRRIGRSDQTAHRFRDSFPI